MPKIASRLLGCLILASLLPPSPPAAAEPATAYTVNSTLDNPDANPGNNICADAGGNCTLRAAVMEANAHTGPDTILLPADIFHLTRAGAQENAANFGDLDLQGSVTLQGMGAAATVVEAAGLNDRVFDVLTGTTASLSQLTIRGGHLTSTVDFAGGGVQNWGTLTLTQVLVTHNHQTVPSVGGGITNQGPGILSLNDSQVISNTAKDGGGIFNTGRMTIGNSRVISNAAEYVGGGVHSQGVMAINASQVLSNTSDDFGGIMNSGQMVVAHSTIGGNWSVQIGGLGNPFGSDARLTISDSTIRDNRTIYGSGGLYSGAGVITVTRSLISGNAADVNGGGVYVISGTVVLADVTVALNTAGYSGGGLVNEGGVLEGYNLTIAGNTANRALVGGNGGGLYHTSGTTNLRNSVLANNQLFYLEAIPQDCYGTVGTFSYSLVQVTDNCTFINDHTLTGLDPLLLPLADNGGPTLTRALAPGSPALDAANPAGCASPLGGLLLTDQRGQPRHADANADGQARCDMGAYEAQLLLFLPLLLR